MKKEFKCIYMLFISCITFILGVTITTFSVTSGPGGTAKVKIGKSSFEIQVNDVNFKQLFNNSQYSDRAKAMAMQSFNMYEIGPRLITAIRNTSYSDEFARSLREILERMEGPFNAPDKEVILIFNDHLDRDKAEVCPNSDFYRKKLNVALSDYSRMTSIPDAGIALIHGCPPKEGERERVVISEEQGRSLLNIKGDSLPSEIEAIVKPLPSYLVVMN